MNKSIAMLVVLGIGGYVLMSSIYTVSEVEQVIITQFGKPVGDPVTSAGLKFKVPFIQEVNPIDKRVLEWDGNPSDMPTKDKLYISVDLFARWRITDPLLFLTSVRDEAGARTRLDDIVDSAGTLVKAADALLEAAKELVDTRFLGCRFVLTEQVDPALGLLADTDQPVELVARLAIGRPGHADQGRHQRRGHQQQVAKAINNQFDLQHGSIADQGPDGRLFGFVLG